MLSVEQLCYKKVQSQHYNTNIQKERSSDKGLSQFARNKKCFRKNGNEWNANRRM